MQRRSATTDTPGFMNLPNTLKIKLPNRYKQLSLSEKVSPNPFQPP